MRRKLTEWWRRHVSEEFRRRIFELRCVLDPFLRLKRSKFRRDALLANRPYEEGQIKEVPAVRDMECTLRYILEKQMSVVRFGDGELKMIDGGNMVFQDFDAGLAARLREILADSAPPCLVCLPQVFESLAPYTDYERDYWRGVLPWCRRAVANNAAAGYFDGRLWFGDAQISRAYLRFRDKDRAARVFELWKMLFAERDILIVEGRYTRIGVGNDLLSSARSIRRIWCPPIGAYSCYDEIFTQVLRHVRKNDLVLISLGATATVLAYDLARLGYQAVDSGQVDLEYIWMKMGVCKLTAVPGRYVSEGVGKTREMVDVPGEVEKNNVVCIIK